MVRRRNKYLKRGSAVPLLLHAGRNRTNVGARTAGNAFGRVDYVNRVGLGNAVGWAFADANAASDTIVRDFISHIMTTSETYSSMFEKNLQLN